MSRSTVITIAIAIAAISSIAFVSMAAAPDLTTYNETDPGDHITVSDGQISVDQIARDTDGAVFNGSAGPGTGNATLDVTINLQNDEGTNNLIGFTDGEADGSFSNFVPSDVNSAGINLRSGNVIIYHSNGDSIRLNENVHESSDDFHYRLRIVNVNNTQYLIGEQYESNSRDYLVQRETMEISSPINFTHYYPLLTQSDGNTNTMTGTFSDYDLSYESDPPNTETTQGLPDGKQDLTTWAFDNSGFNSSEVNINSDEVIMNGVGDDHDLNIYRKDFDPTEKQSLYFKLDSQEIQDQHRFQIGFSNKKHSGGINLDGDGLYGLEIMGNEVRLVSPGDTEANRVSLGNYTDDGSENYVLIEWDPESETIGAELYNEPGLREEIGSATRSTTGISHGDFEYAYLYRNGAGDNDGDVWNGRMSEVYFSDAPSWASEGTEVTVTDQNGDPVPNATLQQTNFFESGFDENDTQSIEEQAEELQNEITDAYPDSFREQVGVTDDAPASVVDSQIFDGSASFDWEEQTSIGSDYVLMHNPDQIAIEGDTYVSDKIDSINPWEESASSNSAFGTPTLIGDGDSSVVFSVWNGAGSGADNQLDNSFPGGIKSAGTVEIEQLSPSGEVVDSWTKDAETTYKIKRDWPRSDSSRDVVSANLPAGHFYRVHPESNEAAAITVAIGNPEDFVSSYQDGLLDQKNQLTEQAERIQNLIEDDTIEHQTVKTDANGTATVTAPSDTARITLTAHAGPDEVLSFVREQENLSASDLPTLGELQDAAQGDLDYNGTVAVSTDMTVLDEDSAEMEEVHVRTVPYKQWGDMEDFEDLQQWIDDLAMGDMNQLPPGWESDLENLNETQLRDLHSQLRSSVIGVPDGLDRFAEEFDIDTPLGTDEIGSESRLRESIVRLSTILETQSTIDPCSGSELCDPDVGDGLLNLEIPVSGAINETASNVMLHWSDGSAPEPIGEDYWSVEESSSLNPFDGGQTLVIDEFPIEDRADGRALADVRPNIVMAGGDDGILPGDDGSDSGTIRRPSIPVQNPAFSGSIPEIDAWDLNKLRPGPDDRVNVRLRTQDDAFGGLENATVYDPDGNVLDRSIGDDGTIRFDTAGEGAHTVRVTYSDTTGAEFTDSLRVRARDEAVSQPPTVRWERGMGSDVAVVGSDLRSARVDRSDGSTDFTVIQSDTDTAIGQLHVHAEEQISGGQDVTMSVLHPDESNVNANVNVNLHTSIAASTLLYRDGTALTHGSETSNGRVRSIVGEAGDREKRVIETYTTADGTLELESVADPGYWERIMHWLDYGIPVPSLPSIGLSLGWLVPVGSVLWKRRRGSGGVPA